MDKKFYNSILSQVFSPCGELLICGSIYGDVAVFNLKSILDENQNPNSVPKKIFSVPNKEQICSLSSSQRFLIVGTVGAIFGYDWETVKEKPEISWTINLPLTNDKLQKTDVNSMFVVNDSQLYAGCGDCKIYSFSLEDGRIVQTFSGHDDYIHSIAFCDEKMVSAGEDGTVRLWDMRLSSMTSKLEPHKDPKLNRPSGKWIGDVDVTQDWLVCGGGPGLSLWHMRTLQMMSTFPETKETVFHVTKLKCGSILAGGSDSHFYQLTYTGNVKSKLKTSASTVYSALYTTNPTEVLTLAGASGDIDICTNFTYRHKAISFYD